MKCLQKKQREVEDSCHITDSWDMVELDFKTQEARLKLNRPGAVGLFFLPVAPIPGLTVKSSGGGEHQGMDRGRAFGDTGRNYSRNVLLLSPEWVVVYSRGG